jgi:putative cardiolipin synthase
MVHAGQSRNGLWKSRMLAPSRFGPASRAVRTILCVILLGVALDTGFSITARGDVFRVLANDRDAAQACIDLIQQARYEVNAAYYVIDGGRVPLVLLTMLRDAALRGLRVRLLVDGLHRQIPVPVVRHLIEAGVEIREYHPLNWSRPDWLNRRMHDKLLIVDCEQLVIGSRNLQDNHFGLECTNFLDQDAYIRGCAAAHASDYFNSLWESRGVRPMQLRNQHSFDLFSGPHDPDPFHLANRHPDEIPALLAELVVSLVEQQWIQLNTGCDWSAGFSDDVPVQFLHDVGKNKRAGSMGYDILGLIETAQHDLVIETPYPVFTHAMVRAILDARARGVRVLLLTNSLSSTDRLVTYADYQNHKHMLLRAGVELWEYAGADHLHAKLMIVDGWIAVIGSYNFDARSELINSEVAVAARSFAAAQALSHSIEQHMAESFPIGANGRADWDGPRHPNAEASQIGRLWMTRLVVPLIRRTL